MTKLKVRLYGDPCLRKKCDPVSEVGPGERMLIEAMIATMHEYKGIGLAASQVGILQQIFVADIGEGPVAVINPRILKKNGSATLEEGCLCIPGVHVDVKRAQKIQVQYLDEYNRTVVREYSDLMARVFLHETDHLHGKMIVDYASSKKKKEIKAQLDELFRKAKES